MTVDGAAAPLAPDDGLSQWKLSVASDTATCLTGDGASRTASAGWVAAPTRGRPTTEGALRAGCSSPARSRRNSSSTPSRPRPWMNCMT